MMHRLHFSKLPALVGVISAALFLMPTTTVWAQAKLDGVPGIVIDHSPASSGLYIGSPGIAILPNGDYLASHDYFGPKSAEFERATTVVFRSADRGRTWRQVARLEGLFWASLFTHKKAAIISISKDGSTASFDPEKGFIDFPGGAKKFTIRFDRQSGLYWSLATAVAERHRKDGRPGIIRNALALTSSPNLVDWTIRSVLLYHPDVARHGFQYVDWQFEKNDIIAACRTAFDDGLGGAHNNHDANFLTFHRIVNFRKKTMADWAPMTLQGALGWILKVTSTVPGRSAALLNS